MVTSECVYGTQWYVWLKFSGAGGSAGFPLGFDASQIEIVDPYSEVDPLNLTGDFHLVSASYGSVCGVSSTVLFAGTGRSASTGLFIGVDVSWVDYHGSIDLEKAVELDCGCGS